MDALPAYIAEPVRSEPPPAIVADPSVFRAWVIFLGEDARPHAEPARLASKSSREFHITEEG